MAIQEHIPLVEEILAQHATDMGSDYAGYRNHVYRMLNFCFALHDCGYDERAKVVIAGCFHDLGIWTGGTFDYLPSSIAAADEYLRQNDLDEWMPEIDLIIDMHHKVRKFRPARSPLVEVFREGDLADFSFGMLKSGLPRPYVKAVQKQFPDEGFHRRLVQLEAGWFVRHPLNPLPIAKW